MLLPILLVLASGMCHAVWSMFTKRSLNKSIFLWSIMMVSTVLLLPVLLIELWTQPLAAGAYALLLLSVALQALYSWLLSITYEMGDLSQIYPVMRGTSTLLIPLIGVIFLKESLSVYGWIGICCMLGGFAVLSGIGARRSLPASSGSGTTLGYYTPILMALCVGLCTTCYVFVDKLNLQHMSPLALLEVTNIGFVAGLTPAVLRSRKLLEEWRRNKFTILLGSVLNPGSYLLFLFALQQAPLAHISPLREIGTIFATLLGVLLLKERQGLRRMICSVVIFCGILLIGIWG
ncbi:EamA family transporter [Paenibacillus sp. FSL R7-277]|uniref:DMT family transporter n=1 Tax=unclassified Paenibacillus TaxID=185978 RepID=UPI0003E23322|nr:EamA family transporter [Paenibacillus sp. FSL R7-277]ETT72271.1 small multidrug resistance protein [Paenibacillus sp. FSL R7-277]